MEDNQENIMILLMGLVLIILIIVIPIGIIFFGLPWYLLFINYYGIILGFIFVIIGIILNSIAIMNLGYKYSENNTGNIDKLVTTGIYSYTRNPMYFGQGTIVVGLFIIFPLTIFLIPLFLFLFALYSRATTEEKELYEKFGEDYIHYRTEVSFIIPNPLRFMRRKRK
ncbi:methyltransferase family protein [Methanobacterium spitsbergense]|uniref:Isoprenylcysteine carboxylmethyltransferase family protein n=1 Tax=Methanobacterium spitsbergense TaxID=2874285 RepID=A0A8T5V484_9EURY|nr:isoprenylcysteine carboxylmethyltransferase family protein [Methanobacterium spitsbergense]MBZ2166485.1 isoprenylcysteine carboxylmethyltransferase family protein [Methanobacterium spitsbergense]